MSGILHITPWERAILQLLASGSAAYVIASHLGISERAVDEQLVVLFAKMGVETRTDAIAAAIRRGLLNPDDPIHLPRAGPEADDAEA